MTGADMSDDEHADWIDAIGDDKGDPPIPYVSPWYRALAAELSHED